MGDSELFQFFFVVSGPDRADEKVVVYPSGGAIGFDQLHRSHSFDNFEYFIRRQFYLLGLFEALVRSLEFLLGLVIHLLDVRHF